MNETIKLQTGDILLYENYDSFLSSLISWYTDNSYYHCSMIINNPTFINKSYTGLYVIDCSNHQRPQYDINTTGVSLVKYEKIIKHMKSLINGKLYYRKLHIDRTKEFYNKIESLCKSTLGKPYDDDFRSYIGLGNYRLERRIDSFRCSSIIAYIYTMLDILPMKTKWSIIDPGDFSSLSKMNKKIINCKLDDEINIFYQLDNII
jgi:hypothetical protein